MLNLLALTKAQSPKVLSQVNATCTSKFTQRKQVSGGHSAYSPFEMGNQVCLQSQSFSNSATRSLPGASFERKYDAIIRPSIWTLPDTTSGCVVSKCCVRRKFANSSRVCSICLREKRFSPPVQLPLFSSVCAQKITRSASAAMFTVAFFVLLARTPFSPLT